MIWKVNEFDHVKEKNDMIPWIKNPGGTLIKLYIN